MELKPRSCPVCGSTETGELFLAANYSDDKLNSFSFASRKVPEAMHLRMLRCTACDLLYASPAPSLDTLEAAYRQADFDSGEEAGFASRTYIRLVSRFLPKLPDLDGALDIGTGDGAFLERLLEQGFTHVQGVEPSAAPIASAKDPIKPLIVSGLFEPESFEAGSFSLVSCFQTLEHVENPAQILSSALRLLKPGGAFVTVSHNFRSVSARMLGSKSPIYDIEHLQLFSTKSMENLLAGCGFTGVVVRSVANTYPLHYWLKILPIGNAVKQKAISLAKMSKIGYIPVSIPAGNIFAIAFKAR